MNRRRRRGCGRRGRRARAREVGKRVFRRSRAIERAHGDRDERRRVMIVVHARRSTSRRLGNESRMDDARRHIARRDAVRLGKVREETMCASMVVVARARGDARGDGRAMMTIRHRPRRDDGVRSRATATRDEGDGDADDGDEPTPTTSTWATPRPFVRLRKTPAGKRPCERCDGYGEATCAACVGSGRVQFAGGGGMFERGAWPRWCGDCRGCGVCACGDCFGTGAHRDPIGFRLGDD